jgi:putative ABC transport system permease protein
MQLSDIRLAWRLLLRDWRAGELGILVVAILIAVASMTSIGIFTNRVEMAMNDQTSRFLGADLILSASQSIDPAINTYADQLGLRQSDQLVFSSVLIANDQFQLSEVKAVDDQYPLAGTITIAKQSYADTQIVNQGPAKGTVWLSNRLLDRLQVKVGDRVELGQASLEVGAILINDPGQASSAMSIAPRLLMNLSDVAGTQVVQPGSRLKYRYLFSGPSSDRKTFANWLKPRLLPTQNLIGGKEGSPALNTAMDRATQYLSLASMLSVILAGIAIAMAANRYSTRHLDQSALLRCMGATQRSVISLYSWQLLIIGIIGSAFGCLVGYLAQQGLVLILADFIPGNLPTVSYAPFITGFLSGVITLIGFALPALLRLKSVPPLRVIRKEILPLPISSLFIYSLAVSAIILIMWIQSDELLLTVIVLSGIALCAFLMLLMTLLLIKLSQQLEPYLHGPWRSGLQQIIRHRRSNRLQILSLSMALMILLTIGLLRTDLLERWQTQLPDNAPNHFIVNIQPYEVEPLKEFLSLESIESTGLYPMVRARLTHINNIDVVEAVPDKAKLDQSLKRELNISWTDKIQQNNQVIKGQWWQPSTTANNLISVEEGIAKRLDINIGDQLSFKTADRVFAGEVTTIRSVQWDSFQPNFYFIFSPGSLDGYPMSYISSFYQPDNKKDVTYQMVRRFPGLTVIEVDVIMKQVRLILNQVTLAVEYVLLFVLLAGMVVLVASIQTTLDNRIQSAVVMRALGATKQYIRSIQIVEFGILGLLSGLLAIMATEIVAFFLYQEVFRLEPAFHPAFWVIAMVSGALLVIITGIFFTRKVLRTPPLRLLKN